MRHIRHALALLTLTAVALTASVPAFALFGKKEPPLSPDAPTAVSLSVEASPIPAPSPPGRAPSPSPSWTPLRRVR